MNQKIIKSLYFTVTFCLIAGALALTGCSGNSVNNTIEQPEPVSGAARITVHIGKIGILAKRQAIDLNHLILTFSSTGEDTVRDTLSISGTGGSEIETVVNPIVAPAAWILNAATYDKTGKLIHSNSTSFSTIPGDTVDVSLGLDAKYSMLRTSFNSIPDSVKAVKLIIHGIDTLDASFTVGAVDSVKLSYDYLPADSAGVAHAISLRASGSYYGTDTVLYAADTTIISRSGVDSHYQIILKWVGPGVPKGAVTMTITIGTVGTTVINAGFEERRE